MGIIRLSNTTISGLFALAFLLGSAGWTSAEIVESDQVPVTKMDPVTAQTDCTAEQALSWDQVQRDAVVLSVDDRDQRDGFQTYSLSYPGANGSGLPVIAVTSQSYAPLDLENLPDQWFSPFNTQGKQRGLLFLGQKLSLADIRSTLAGIYQKEEALTPVEELRAKGLGDLIAYAVKNQVDIYVITNPDQIYVATAQGMDLCWQDMTDWRSDLPLPGAGDRIPLTTLVEWLQQGSEPLTDQRSLSDR